MADIEVDIVVDKLVVDWIDVVGFVVVVIADVVIVVVVFVVDVIGYFDDNNQNLDSLMVRLN